MYTYSNVGVHIFYSFGHGPTTFLKILGTDLPYLQLNVFESRRQYYSKGQTFRLNNFT